MTPEEAEIAIRVLVTQIDGVRYDTGLTPAERIAQVAVHDAEIVTLKVITGPRDIVGEGRLGGNKFDIRDSVLEIDAIRANPALTPAQKIAEVARVDAEIVAMKNGTPAFIARGQL